MNGWATVTVSGPGVRTTARGEFANGENVDWIRFPTVDGSGVLTTVSAQMDDGSTVSGSLYDPVYVAPNIAVEIEPGAIFLRAASA